MSNADLKALGAFLAKASAVLGAAATVIKVAMWLKSQPQGRRR